MTFLHDFWLHNAFWLLPILICLSRIVDVTIGTLRIVFLSRGMKLWAPLLGFFEVLIWLVAISYVMQNLNHWTGYIAYAAGFALGNLVGLYIEEWMAFGFQSIWIVAKGDATGLADRLRDENFGITRVAARGTMGKVRIVIVVVRRRHIQKAISIIRHSAPDAFVAIQDVRSVKGGFFTDKIEQVSGRQKRIHAEQRKGK